MRKLVLVFLALVLVSQGGTLIEPIFLFLEKDGSRGKVNPLSREDLRLHPAESFWYTESYFFIAYLDSGEIAYLNLIVSNMGLKKNQPALTLTIITPTRERLTTEKDFKPEDLKLSENPFSIRIGENVLSGDDRRQKLSVKQEQLGLELEFSSPVQGFKLGDGCAYFGAKKDIYFCINYPAPRARVSGYITYNGKKVNAKGWGYLDHSWYNADTAMFEKIWHNLKFFSPEQNLLITSFITTENYGGKNVAVVSLVNDQKVVFATTDLIVTESSIEFDPAGQKSYPKKILFEFKHSDYSGRIHFDSSKIVEKMDVLEKLNKSATNRALKWAIQTFKQKPFYYRSFGPAELELNPKGSSSIKISGQASCEVIFVK